MPIHFCLVVLVVTAWGCQPTAGSNSKRRNEALRAELIALQNQDLTEIAAIYADPQGAVDDPAPHLRRTQRLGQIVARYGWPTNALVGEDGARAAWLIAQHADEDPKFQRQCLTLMEKAARAGQADWTLVACLTDRVLVAHGQSQRYGTQGNGGRAEEVPAIDARRKVLGLPTLEEYRQHLASGGKTLCRP